MTERTTQHDGRRVWTDEEIEALSSTDSEIPAISDSQLASAVAVTASGAVKTPISIRIFDEALEWFKASGPGYQSRINDALLGVVRGAYVGPLDTSIVKHFNPSEPGFVDRVSHALREHIRVERAMRERMMRSGDKFFSNRGAMRAPRHRISRLDMESVTSARRCEPDPARAS